MDKKKIMALAASINKKEGEGALFHLGSKSANLKLPRWSSNIEDLDAAIGGGIPKGRIIEIFGPESSGKTSLGYHLMAQCELALDIPVEGTFDATNATSFGNRKDQLLVYRAKYGEQAMNKALQFAQAGIPIIVIDSVPALKPKEDIDKIIKNANKINDAQQEEARMGGVARLLHKMLPVLEQVCETTGTTLILINQVRDKMNAMMFGEKDDTPGGRAPKFYSSVRIKVARKKYIEVPNKDPRNTATNEKIGMILKGKVVKSKVSNPGAEFEIPLIYGVGFVSFDEVPEIRNRIMKENNEKFSKKRKSYDEDFDDAYDDDLDLDDAEYEEDEIEEEEIEIPDYSTMTAKQLYEECKKRKLKGNKVRQKKEYYIALLEKDDES